MTDSFAVSAPTTLSSAQIDNWTLPRGAPTVPFEHEKFVAAIDVPDARRLNVAGGHHPRAVVAEFDRRLNRCP